MLDTAVRPVAPPAVRRRTFPALPWLLVAVAAAVVLLRTGVSIGDLLRYAAYLVVVIALPGTLVHRLLRGSRGNLPEDLGFGAAVGLVLQLVVWAVAPA